MLKLGSPQTAAPSIQMGPASRNVASPELGIMVTEAGERRPTEPDKSLDAPLSAPRNRDVLPGASPNGTEPIRQWGEEQCDDTAS